MKNYINMLTQEDVIDVLKQNNLVLVEDNKKKVIKRTKQGIVVRCQKAKSISKQIRDMIEKSLPYVKNVLFDNNMVDEEPEDNSEKILLIQNFAIYEVLISETKQISYILSSTYYDFMCEKFGEDYAQDYNSYQNKMQNKEPTK